MGKADFWIPPDNCIHRYPKPGSVLSYLDGEPGIKRYSFPFCGQHACFFPDNSKDCKECQKRKKWYLNYLKHLNDID